MTTTSPPNRYLRNTMLWLEGQPDDEAGDPSPERGDRTRPYVGPQEFETDDHWRFFGRDRERTVLRQLLIAERIVLLYSPSGAGKTSLIKASLLRDLVEEDDFDVLPVIRVGREPGPAPHPAAADRMDTTLSEYLDRRQQQSADDRPIVLVFDQFEEILTTDPTDDAGRREFFTQLGVALRNRQRWALFSMREDYLGGLDDYRRLVPTQWATTFRLDLLGTDGARAGIQRPAALCGVAVSDAAATQLVKDLSSAGKYVEPVQLQVACLSIWSRLPPGATAIEASDVEAAGGVDQALADYYDRSVAEAAAESGVGERAIRRWVDRELITAHGIRGQVLREPDRSRELDNRAIECLVDHYVVRKDERRGATWYELAHDRLVRPVQTSNTVWFQQNLNVLQRQAEVWKNQDQPTSLLLRGAALKDASRWAEEQPEQVSDVERELLTRSRTAAKQNNYLAVAVLSAIVILLSGFAGFAFLQWQRADEERDVADNARSTAEVGATEVARQQVVTDNARVAANVRAEEAATQRAMAVDAESTAKAGAAELSRLNSVTNALLRADHQDRLDVSLVVGREASNVVSDTSGSLSEAEWRLLGTLAGSQVQAFFRGHQAPVRELVLSPDGRTLASADQGGSVYLWSAKSGLRIGPPLDGPAPDLTVYDLSFSRDGKRLAGADKSGKIWIWTVADGERAGDPLVGPSVDGASALTLAFDPDPDRADLLAAGYRDGSLLVWDVARRSIHAQPAGHADSVVEVAYAPDGSALVSAGQDGSVTARDPDTGEPRREITRVDEATLALAMSWDGTQVATGGERGTVRRWDVATGEQLGDPIAGPSTGIWGIAYNEDGTSLAISGTEAGVMVWDVAQDRPQAPALAGYTAPTYSVAFAADRDGGGLFSGSGDGTIVMWSAASAPALAYPLVGGPGRHDAASVAFSPDSSALVAAFTTGIVERWAVDPWQLGVATREDVLLVDFPNVTGTNVTAMTLSEDGATVAAGFCERSAERWCAESSVRLWDAETGLPRGDAIANDADAIRSLAFSRDGALVAAGDSYGHVTVWETGTDREFFVRNLGKPVTSLAFSPDGRRLATGGQSGLLRLWSLASGKSIKLDGHTRQVWAIDYSPDGAVLASGGQDGQVILWDGIGRRPTGRPLVKHVGPVKAVAFTRDGSSLASTGMDRSILLWDTTTTLAVARPLPMGTGLIGSISSVAVSPDGRRLAVGGRRVDSADRNQSPLVLWAVDRQTILRRSCTLAGRNLTREEWGHYFAQTEYRPTCLDGVLHEADTLWLDGKNDDAKARFEVAVELARASSNADDSNATCWRGTIDGLAETVMPACERAVALAPTNGNTYDSRALARGAMGDVAGAADDLEVAIAWMAQMGVDPSVIDQRERWLRELRAGRNPFADVEANTALRREALTFASYANASFTPAEYGVTVPWTDDWSRSSLSAAERAVSLTLSSNASATVVKVDAFRGGDVRSCVSGAVDTLGDGFTGTFSNVGPASAGFIAPTWPGTSSSDRDYDFTVVTYDWTPDERETSSRVGYVACHALGEQGMLRVTALIPTDAYGAEVTLVELLLAGIRLPVADPPEDDASASSGRTS